MSNRLLLAVALLFVFSHTYASCCIASRRPRPNETGPVLGGLDKERLADDEAREVVESVQEELEDKSETTYKKLVPISFRTQVVAGRNFFVKVVAVKRNFKISILHLEIHRGLPHTGRKISLGRFKEAEKDTELEYF